MEQKASIIHIDPQILNGTPVFTRTRVPVATLFEYLGRGASLAEFLADFPSVGREQAIGALKAAKEALLGRDKRLKQSVVDLLESTRPARSLKPAAHSMTVCATTTPMSNGMLVARCPGGARRSASMGMDAWRGWRELPRRR